MTAEIINLRRARKARDRRQKDARAEENRALFGQTRHERDIQQIERDLSERRLDGAQRAPKPDASIQDEAGVPGSDPAQEPGSTS